MFDASPHHARRLDNARRARREAAAALQPFALVRPSGVRAVGVPAVTAWLVALLVAVVSVIALSIGPGSPLDASAFSAAGAGAKLVQASISAPTPTPVPAFCFTSGPSSGAYTVTVCITLPASDAILSGSSTVTGTVSSTDPTVSVQRAIFTIDGAPLLTDYTSPYTFTLDTRRWVDGPHQLRLAALMRDGFTSALATLPVTFANGITQPPTNDLSFTPATGTTPAPGAPLVLAAAGDGAGGEPGETSTVGLINSWNPNMFLYLGDVYDSGQPMEFDNWYGAQGAAGTYGQFRNITNPTIGNHEYTATQAPGYFWYWDNIPNYYSFDAGGWHFISLNSTSQYGGTATTSAQYQWLQSDLAANADKACTVVYFHHPLYNTGPEGSTTSLQAIWQLLAEKKVTMVLNGHDHSYQRFSPIDGSGAVSATGVTEFIVGSGGHGHQGLTSPDPKLAAADYANFGALKLSLYGTSATFQFVTTSGVVNDSGLIPCKNTVDSEAPTAPPTFGATAASPSQIDLSWGGSTDNIGVAGYEIFRDGGSSPLVTLPPDARSYSDTPLAPSSTHSYRIKAFDAAGNRSAPSGPISQTTLTGTVTLTLNAVADSYVSSSTITANYGTSTALRVQRSSATLRSYLRFDLSGVVGSIQNATLLVYSNSTGPSGYDVFGVADTTWGETAINYNNAPSLGASTGISSGAIVSGSWTSVNVTALATAGNGGLMSLALGPSGSTQRSFASRESAFAPKLVLTIGAGNGGPPIASFTASTSTVTAGLPVSFTDTSTGGAMAWSWSFGDTGTSSAQSPSHTWATAGTYTVNLIATNAYGSSAPATTQISVVADTAAPSTPGALTATPITSTRIDLAWTASSDNVGVTGYRIYRDGNPTPIVTVSGATLAYQDLAVAPGTTYTYTVDAIDAAGNPSAQTGAVSATTPSGSVTLTRNPIADAYVDSVNSTTNYGTNSSIRVSGPSQIRHAYLKFDLTGISSSFSSATLRVYCISGCSTTGFVARAVTDSTWGESSITYANAPAFSSSIAGSSGALVVGWNTIDVSSIVSAGAGGLTSLVLTTTGSQINLSSREGSFRPELVIVLGGP